MVRWLAPSIVLLAVGCGRARYDVVDAGVGLDVMAPDAGTPLEDAATAPDAPADAGSDAPLESDAGCGLGCGPEPLGVSVVPRLDAIADTYAVLGDLVLFVASNGRDGFEPWVSDGTAAGTVQLADIRAGGSSDPMLFTPAIDRLYFFADDGGGLDLWVTDGTPAGTRAVFDFATVGGSIEFHVPAALGTRLVFRGRDATSGREPWISDGTTMGTRMLFDVAPGAMDSSPSELHALDATRVVFNCNDRVHGVELWVTDGTSTSLLVDAAPGATGSLDDGWFRYFASGGGRAYYRGTDGTSGRELWVTDGTAGGTRLVADIQSGAGDGVYGAPHPSVLGTLTYFTATSPVGVEPWVTDGTSAGTRALADIHPTGDSLSVDGTYLFTAHRGAVYFRADDGVNGLEPWVSDDAGVHLLADVNPSGASVPYSFFSFGGFLYFAASTAANGYELHRTDGTADGTVLFHEFQVGTTDSYPEIIGVTPGFALFAADGGRMDRYLWVLR